jgi:hypothetical protein
MACVCFLPNGRPYWSLPLPWPVTGVFASARSPPMVLFTRAPSDGRGKTGVATQLVANWIWMVYCHDTGLAFFVTFFCHVIEVGLFRKRVSK